MKVTAIEPLNGKKSRIYIDEERAFVLYKGEIRKYQLALEQEIRMEVYEEILTEVLTKRARQRVLYLLQSMDRTERQIYDKLKQNEYPENIIKEVIEYIKTYGYIDDEKYAQTYIENQRHKKSRRVIETELRRKGIEPQIIEKIFQLEENKIDESLLIRNWIECKKVDVKQASREELYKLYQFLLRKGFAYEKISKELRLY